MMLIPLIRYSIKLRESKTGSGELRLPRTLQPGFQMGVLGGRKRSRM